jgi:hypothetical protein
MHEAYRQHGDNKCIKCSQKLGKHRQLGKPTCKWKNNIKAKRKRTECDGMD